MERSEKYEGYMDFLFSSENERILNILSPNQKADLERKLIEQHNDQIKQMYLAE